VSTKNKWTLNAHFPNILKDVNFGRLPTKYLGAAIFDIEPIKPILTTGPITRRLLQLKEHIRNMAWVIA